jgi:hypothetical protein
MAYDTVYYWTGGTERGEWRETFITAAEIEETLASVRRQGYVAVRGSKAIGPPEGAPSAERLRAVLTGGRS